VEIPRATIERPLPALRKLKAAPVPRSPQPTRAALISFPSGAFGTNEGIPSCSRVKLSLFPVSELLHEVIKGVIPKGIDAPSSAEVVKKSLHFIVDFFEFLNDQ
jgi:hypothetical protein